MKRNIGITILVVILFLFLSATVFCNNQEKNEKTKADGWSSIDNVFYKLEEDMQVKKPGTGPVKIGYTVREVQEVLGMPDRTDEEERILYYRNSPIFFGTDWKVKSWDNRYGNIDVLTEEKEIRLGCHVQGVFQEEGLPLRIKKDYKSYQLEYIDQFVYVNEMWTVVAIQSKNIKEFKKDRNTMDLEDFLKEFKEYLKD